MNKVEKLQDNLSALRKLSNWTAQDLANKLGVSKQTINNLENRTNGTTMSKLQYIAIRAVLEHEATENNNELLANTITILLDDNSLSIEKQKELSEKIKIITSSKTKNINQSIFSSMIKDILPVVAGATLITLAFLSDPHNK